MTQLSILLASIVLFSCSDTRTQEPHGAVAYRSEDVSFESLDGEVTLFGTLTTPANEPIKTAVLLITGSGPQDRDYTNQFGHRPFLVLSHYLTQRGIAVLRYDERGVGESEGNYQTATYQNLVSDAAGGIAYLKKKGFESVGVIGHSQGGGIAPLASEKVAADFLVLLAGVATTAEKVLTYNTKYRLQKMKAGEDVQKEIIGTVDSLLKILKAEGDPEVAKKKMEDFINRKEKAASIQYKEAAEKLGDAQRLIEGWLDPKFIYSLHTDPLVKLRKVRIPVLVIYGDDDGTIDVKTMVPVIEEALDSTVHQVKVFHGLGHLLMNSRGVPIHKLHEVEETIAPEVLEYIDGWIKGL